MRVAFGRFVFDSDTRELLDAGVRVHLAPKAFDLLQLLLERRPSVVTKQEIHERVWHGAFVVEASLSVAIADIRQVLREPSSRSAAGQPGADGFIRTVHRVGYAFSGEVQELTAAPSTSSFPYRRCWVVRNDRSFALAPGENLVGRDPRSAVWVDATGVSRRHARIDVDGAGATLVDLDSSNGTFIAGERVIGARPLVDGTEIELGAATIVFREWSEQTAPQTERITRKR